MITNSKYYDYIRNRYIDINSDGCDLKDWHMLNGKVAFARSPKGFMIFLDTERISNCDEYAVKDPYTVEINLNSEFQKRRIDLTIELAKAAISPILLEGGIPKILDLGCGQGHITHVLQEKISPVEISGLDYSFLAIEYAHNNNQGIDYIVADAYNPPYSARYFDLVICNNLYEHVPDPLYLLQKIDTILKIGGHIIVSTPSRYRLSNLVRILRGKVVALMSEHHVTEYTVGQVVEQLKYGGFQVESIMSRPILRRRKIAMVVEKIINQFLKMLGSHHKMEETVFYLAKKNNNNK